MATYKPISNTVPQYHVSGEPASGYYLKGYQAGTTTALSMATDNTGGTTLAKCQINSAGYPINGSSAVFIPHFNEDYKLVLYTNSTDADADTTGNAVWVVDNLSFDEAGSEWLDQTHTPTRLTNTTFELATGDGDQTAVYHVGRRVKLTDSSTLYAIITAVDYNVTSASKTHVTVDIDSGNLSASLSAVAVGILSATNQSANALGVTFLPAGTNGVTTNVQAKLREIVTVTDKGVTGDGVTDDAPAINNASADLNTAGGGDLIFPGPATYLIDDHVQYYSNQRWIFQNGAKLKAASGAESNVQGTVDSTTINSYIRPAAKDVDNIEIVNLELDGNKSGNNTVDTGSGLSLHSVSNARIINPRIYNISRDGIVIQETSTGQEPADIYIENPDIQSCGNSVTTNGVGIVVGRVNRCTIINPYCASNKLYGIDIEPNGADPADSVVGCYILGGELTANGSDGNGADLGIYSAADLQIRDVTIDGTVLRSGGNEGLLIGGASTYRCKNVHIRDVKAIKSGRNGFRVDNQTDRFVTFTRCVAEECSQNSTGTYSGFKIDAPQIDLINCRAYDGQGTPTQNYGLELGTNGRQLNIVDFQGFGNSTALFSNSFGQVTDRNIVDGSSNSGNGAGAGVEADLTSITIPKGTFWVADDTVCKMEAFGYTSADADTKTLKVYLDGTAILSTNTTDNSKDWFVEAWFRRSASTTIRYFVRVTIDTTIVATARGSETVSNPATNAIVAKISSTGVAAGYLVQEGMVIRGV